MKLSGLVDSDKTKIYSMNLKKMLIETDFIYARKILCSNLCSNKYFVTVNEFPTVTIRF